MNNRFIIFLFLLAVILPSGFSNWGLIESSEARYAQISKEMYTSGDYVHPKLLGIQHYHKPPVTYYITCLGYCLFGVNEFGARFFLHIALFLQILLVYKISQLLYKNAAVSLGAILIYFSYPVVHIAANNLTTDAYLTTFIFSSIYFFLKYVKHPKDVVLLYLTFVMCGLAFLTKGPVGIIPQLVFAIFYNKFFKEKRQYNIHHFLSFTLGLLISASWYLILVLKDRSIMDYFINHQIVDRVAGDSFQRTEPFWYYIILMPLLGLPAFYYFLQFVFSKIRSIRSVGAVAAVLLLSLLVLIFVFSASSSKLILYVLPLYLFIAILSAKYLSEVSLSTHKIFENISIGYGLLVFIGLIVFCFIPSSFIFPKVIVMVLGFIGIICLFVLKRMDINNRFIKAPLINAVTILILAFMFPFILKENDLNINSTKSLAEFIKSRKQNVKPGSIAVYNYLIPSLAFYTNEKIITINDGYHLSKREIQFEKNNTVLKSTYFDLKHKDEIPNLAAALSKPNSYIIALKKRPLPDSLSFLRNSLPNEIVKGKWIIYY